MSANKVCPVVLRRKGESTEVLAFRHPSEQIQLVKGTVEPGEDLAAAAARELAEESGIISLAEVEFKGSWNADYKGQTWHFFDCIPDDDLREKWTFFTQDDGGAYFEFFWFDLRRTPGDDWSDVYVRALDFIRQNFF